ncbi:multiple organellar RNA editing factor 8, chloroplastic/mitochondrial-like [Lolium rigidum]|uniref:multiple organellar RNA editing factor 8, chloroplastic/mitochondrial-like n=1 Tax=Lolium rigidum TaxID=89674 RepID=UPI001F5DEB0C|nr:multiple organellar RNA editing factor 8, chloroplastic/mitochondrial-like [Lolium rigidum]
MASASRALRLSKLSLLPAAASRFLRPLAAAGSLLPAARGPSPARGFATQPAASSLRDNSPNWTNRPPKETILLDGCDFEHWLVVMDPPPGNPANPDVPREEIIDTYIKTLAQIVGSEEEARMKIYSVSTRHYFAFGALVSEELSYKLKELPKVRWVLPDSYLDVKNKDYGGEPFIDGQAVAYDPKYHEEWVRNDKRAGERIRRNDRPRSFDSNRPRGFDRRSGPPPPPPPVPNQQMPPRDAPPMRPAQGNFQPQAPQNQQPGYGPGVGPNYPNAPHPGYQPGNQGNPGGNMQSGPGPAYQGNNPGYQSGGPGNPPPPPFPGSNQPPLYQGGGRGYASGAPEQQGQAGNTGYQGSGNYNNNAPLPVYEGRDGPGRHYQ